MRKLKGLATYFCFITFIFIHPCNARALSCLSRIKIQVLIALNATSKKEPSFLSKDELSFLYKSSVRQVKGNRALFNISFELNPRRTFIQSDFSHFVSKQGLYQWRDGTQSSIDKVAYRGMLITKDSLERIQREGLTREQMPYDDGTLPTVAEHWFSRNPGDSMGYNIYRAPQRAGDKLNGDVLFVVFEMDQDKLPKNSTLENHIRVRDTFAVFDTVPPEALSRAYVFNPNTSSSEQFKAIDLHK